MHKQEKLTHTTIEELKEMRRPPKYTRKQFLIQLFFFMLFGIPRALFCMVYGVIAAFFWISAVTIWQSLGAPEYLRQPLKLFWCALARILLFLLGIIRINYRGQPDSDARFIISNHTCFFDAWMFLPLLPRPLDKKELLEIPCIGEMWRVFDGIVVDRTKSNGATKILIENAYNPDFPMIQMFPEGATTNGDYMLRFHLGAFLSDVPLQPCAIRYTLWGASKQWTHLSFFHNYPKQWLAFLCIPAITVNIDFLETVSLKIHQDYEPNSNLRQVNQESDPRRFADEVALLIGNFLGVPVLDMTSSAIYKKDKGRKVE